mmetsp:Transcript_5508/g.19159  ORF Transcript_5508/g.19159 Transcript_5508/m.19159 type:complete len:322 (-) Transcript_5508:413-1378(-)
MLVTPALVKSALASRSTLCLSASAGTRTHTDPYTSEGAWHQKCGWLVDTTELSARSCCMACSSSCSRCRGTRCRSVSTDCCKRGTTEARMSTDMNVAATGSGHCHPFHSTNSVDTITPTLPSVSARMCRNTARMLWSTTTPPGCAAPACGASGGVPRSTLPLVTSHSTSSPAGALDTSLEPSSLNTSSAPGKPRSTWRWSPDSGSTSTTSPSLEPMATTSHAGDSTTSSAVPWSSVHTPPTCECPTGHVPPTTPWLCASWHARSPTTFTARPSTETMSRPPVDISGGSMMRSMDSSTMSSATKTRNTALAKPASTSNLPYP